ncbi:hypothetical protein [Acuticoccus mangrovi]|uniref:Uncharacterized protein n=1 Tax=Acuticoccus mangrovi TaxID=2796142 RepID=A0A934IPR4_9HYPH|nr:hypothetical protein [Acuticoccus mangrovi]MBJ3776421.1 hypothetical protein [Acuticoccus mangrovi]
MSKRLVLWVAIAGLMIVGGIGLRAGALPVAQLDLFLTGGGEGDGSTDIDLRRPEVLRALELALATLGSDRAAALVRPRPGAAVAGEGLAARVADAVAVWADSCRVRLRLASADVAAAHRVLTAIGGTLTGPRVRLAFKSEASGGAGVLVADLVALFGGMLLFGLVAVGVGRRRPGQRCIQEMRAPTGMTQMRPVTT